MSVTVYTPQISIVVKKVVRRTATVAAGVDVSDRVSAAASDPAAAPEIDLTPFLAQGTAVRVRRTVRGPDTGQFSFAIPDQFHPKLGDSIYGLVEPMDVIEIRMSRDPVPAGEQLPIVLRGFVSEVSRAESMGPRGPIRMVSISGHDYSKILNIIRFIYLPTMIPAQLLLSSFSLFLNYGVESTGFETPAEFVIKVVNEVVAEYIGKMQAASGGKASPVQVIKPYAIDAQIAGSVQPFGVQQWEGGNVYDLLATFGDVGAWAELFIEDDVDGPLLVYRPIPFKNAAGDYVQFGTSVEEIDIPADAVLTMQVGRSDANVANYYWVDAPRLQLVQNPLTQLDQQLAPSPALDGYQNALATIYGIRLMREATNQGLRYDGKPEAEVDTGQGEVMGQVNEKRRILIEANKDNVVFESGTMTLKGSPVIRPGYFLNIDRGGFVANYYAVEADHVYVHGVSYTTSVTVERGTSFIERVQRGADNPAYLAELTTGGIYE